MSSSTEDIINVTTESVINTVYGKMKHDFNELLVREGAVEDRQRGQDAREKKLNEKEEKVTARESKVVDYQKEGRGLAVDIMRREKKVRNAEQETADREAKLSEREWAVIRREREFEEMEEDLVDAKKKAERFRNSSNLASEQVAGAIRRGDKLEKRVTTLETEKKRYQTAFSEQAKRAEETLEREMLQNSRLSKKIDELRDENLELNGSKAELQERVTFLEKENARLREGQNNGGPTLMGAASKNITRKPVPTTYHPSGPLLRPGYAQSTFSSRRKSASPLPEEHDKMSTKPSLPGKELDSVDSSTVTFYSFYKRQDNGSPVAESIHSGISSLELPLPVPEGDVEPLPPHPTIVRVVKDNDDTLALAGGNDNITSAESTSPSPLEMKVQSKRSLTPALRQAIGRTISPPDCALSTPLLPSVTPGKIPAPPQTKLQSFQQAMKRSSRWISHGTSRSVSAFGASTFSTTGGLPLRSASGGAALRKKPASVDLHGDLLKFTPEKERVPHAADRGSPQSTLADEETPVRAVSGPCTHRIGAHMTDERYQRVKETCARTKAEREKKKQEESESTIPSEPSA